MKRVYKLSPSDLTFLWDECKRCFYLKVTRGYKRPAAPFPKIFGRIDLLMKEFYTDKRSREIHPDLPEGIIFKAGGDVESEIIHVNVHEVECYIKGKYDTLLKFNDGTYGVVDFKTAEVKSDHVPFYTRQLQAYAYALEHPEYSRGPSLSISLLGLLCFEPGMMDKDAQGRLTYRGQVVWQPCPINEKDFLSFIGEILAVLEKPEPPDVGEKCEYCKYRELARVTNV